MLTTWDAMMTATLGNSLAAKRARLLARIERITEIEMRDPNRFAPNPLGPGYLTRRERYNELRWRIEDRIKNLGE